jgi:hypothetical protein
MGELHGRDIGEETYKRRRKETERNRQRGREGGEEAEG